MGGDGEGEGMMTTTTMMTMTTDGSFLDLLTALLVADCSIGGPLPGRCSMEQLAVGCKLLIFHSIKCAFYLILISFLSAILFLHHFT
jgi:hypothetical protein